MEPSISVLSGLKIAGAVVLSDTGTEFPEDPGLGTLVVRGQGLFARLQVNGMHVWYPLVRSAGATYSHNQGASALQWTVNHNLDTTSLWYQVQDANGNIVEPASFEVVNDNSFKLHFSQALVGTCVVIANAAIDTPTLTTALIQVGANVLIDSNGITINGQTVLTSGNLADIVASQIAEATYTQTQVTDLIAQALNDFKATLYVL
jgi:hypothetical protein